MKKGDLVLITDGSYAIRVDSFEKRTHIGLCMDTFEVVGDACNGHLSSSPDRVAHDIFIKNQKSGRIYLHSSPFVKKVAKPETIELNGKTYIKTELEEALAKIKPVGE